jgi:hypothetical protein
MECEDPFGLERKIKEVFNKKFILIAGNENNKYETTCQYKKMQ